ncbi:cbb3-type cytochrome oxidase subunit 3 [Marinomonas sp. PE14-40]|uniref:cbb3-type cytochrome oxidase subunit 3 n=1 Tax=Marinomonas sp. PE14-40 TaxID=3060621 RepID=UPI003F676618
MDINTLRSIATVLAFVAFIAVTLWAFSKRKKGDFNEAANLPFDDDEDMPNKQSAENKQK